MSGGHALLASLCLMAAVACTKVIEQPQVEATPPAPPPPPVHLGTRPVRAPSRNLPPPPTAPQAQAQAADVVAAPRADTLNGDPGGPKRADMQKAIDRAMPSFQSCFREATGSVNVSLSFSAAASGRAEAARVTGGGPVIDGCLTRAIGQLRLPEFTGEAVPIQFPLAVERTVTPAAASATRAPVDQPPPSVFVKP
jgi:hypothetical protein